MSQNGFVALMNLIYTAAGFEEGMPPAVALGNAWFSGFAFVIVGLVLFYLTVLLTKVNMKAAVCIGIGGIGMFAFGAIVCCVSVQEPVAFSRRSALL